MRIGSFLMALGLVLGLLAASGGTVSAQQRTGTCMVSDPTGTPLNIRATPNGRKVGIFYNGDRVVIYDTARDGKGRPWALVGPASGSVAYGWVFREFISCW